MINKSSSRLRLNQLKNGLNKWRLAFLFFALAYAVSLLLTLNSSPMQWDEIVHLNGGTFLNWGLFNKFVDNSFYPPLFDVITFIFFKVFGVSLFSARLVPLMFSILALWAVFELAYSMYGGKTALLSSVLLGIMLVIFGFQVWLCWKLCLFSSLRYHFFSFIVGFRTVRIKC
jgi:4-amino-4-deoxy-L-arabinose transferase-like glycosyltransferase